MVWKRGTKTATQGADQKKSVFMKQSPVTMALCSPPLCFTEAILLSDCWAGTYPSCFSAMCMKLKKKESFYNLLKYWTVLAFHSSAVGKTLALSGEDVCHCWATLCFAALLACAAFEHMSLIRQLQCSLSLLCWKGTSPNLPSGSTPWSCRALQMAPGEKGITAKTREMS